MIHLRCGMLIVAHFKRIEIIVSQGLLGICFAWLNLVSARVKLKTFRLSEKDIIYSLFIHFVFFV